MWIDRWTSGHPPQKKSLLLVGPPGIGKTTIASAIAKDAGWDTIELNASEERNAAVIRRAAGEGAKTHSLASFLNGDERTDRTLIILDEVDHLGGGYGLAAESTIDRTIEAGEGPMLQGDRGGKAELMRLLATTQQPIIMTCNDRMKLWSPMRNWRRNRDRMMAMAEMVTFERASATSLERVARRVLDKEGVPIEPLALDALVRSNPGDIRALVRDLQTLAETSEGTIDAGAVRDSIELGARDEQIDVISGLREMFGTRQASRALRIGKELDKDPDELMDWVAWNSAGNISDSKAQARTSTALSMADMALSIIYRNRAYRSWAWGGSIASLATCATSATPPGRIHISYPDFLRRRGEPWRSGSVIDRLAESGGASMGAVIEELWPTLLAIHDERLGGNPKDCTISWCLDLDVEDHLALHGLRSNARATGTIKEIFEQGRPESTRRDSDRIKEQLAKAVPTDGADSVDVNSQDEEIDSVEEDEESSQTTLDLY